MKPISTATHKEKTLLRRKAIKPRAGEKGIEQTAALEQGRTIPFFAKEVAKVLLTSSASNDGKKG